MILKRFFTLFGLLWLIIFSLTGFLGFLGAETEMLIGLVVIIFGGGMAIIIFSLVD